MIKTLTLEEKRQIKEEGRQEGILILKKLYEKGKITKEEYLEEVEKLRQEKKS